MTKKEAILTAWRRQIARGSRLKDPKHGQIRVMAMAEGYAMVRRPRCSPFVMPLAKIVEWERLTGDESAKR